MKHIKIVLFSFAMMILFCAKGHATTYFLKTPFGWNPQQITPLSLLPKPASNPAEEIKTAAIYWLPDYMKGNVSRGNTDPVKDPFKENCEDNYDLNTICPTPKISTGILHITNELDCQDACICPSNYKYHSENCNGNYVLAGSSCNDDDRRKGDGKIKYTLCRCSSSYPYSTSNCNGEYEVGGSSCNDDRGTFYSSCNPRPCSDGGYYDSSSQTNMKCSGVTYGGRTCYSCYQPSCSEGGYNSSDDSSMVCSSTSYYGQTCYNCRSKTCSDGGYSSSSISGQTCSGVTYEGMTCYSCTADPCAGLTDKQCDSGCASYYSQCPSKCQSCKTCSPYSNETGCTNGDYDCSDGCGGTRKCCKVCDPEDRTCSCPGKVYCDPETKVGSGATCTAGGKTFYETCLVKETCNNDYIKNDKGTCYTNTGSIGTGWYQTGTKCTKQDGSKIYTHFNCSYSWTDCYGNLPPCAGKKECPGDKGTGECSCGGKKYFETCADTCDDSSLSENGGYCLADTTTSCFGQETCGYYVVKSKCTTSTGKSYVYIYDCNGTSKDCNGNTPRCAGYQECENGSIGSGGSCTCGGKTYYKTCSSCDTSGGYINSEYYTATDDPSRLSTGWTTVQQKCTLPSGTPVYYYTECNADKSLAPCRGKITKSKCSSGQTLGGSICSCGGTQFGDYCIQECPYEDTAETCAAQGKEFESKCHGDGANESEWIWYGICK